MARGTSALLVLLLALTLLYVTSTQDLEGCGKTKGCFRDPEDCSQAGCLVYLTWEALPDSRVQFSLGGMVTGADRWVAFGLKPAEATEGNDMIPAEVYAVTSRNALQRSANYRGKKLDSWPLKIPTGAISKQSITVEDDTISGVFTRALSLENSTDSFFYNISGDHLYKVIMAVGQALNDNGTIVGNMHFRDWASEKPVKLTAFTEESASEIPLEKIHACLMVIGWVGFASVGITMARYFKPMWPASTLLGQKVWFTIHRTSMVVCVVCFIPALIVIFVEHGPIETGGCRDSDNPRECRALFHAVLGIIVTILGVLNPIMALFRPHPGTPKRPVFNWAHFGVGISAHVIALLTVLLGIGWHNQSLIDGLPGYTFPVFIVFVAFHFLIWILFEVQRCMTESKARSDDIPLNSAEEDLGNSEQPVDSMRAETVCMSQVTQEGSTAKITLLSIYTLGVGIIVAFLIIVIIAS